MRRWYRPDLINQFRYFFLIAAVASAVSLESEQIYSASILPEQKTAAGYEVGAYVQTGKTARQVGRFVDLCPNAGKCDFSPDQKIGGEILNIDIEAVKNNMAAADLGTSNAAAQKFNYERLQ